MRIARVYGNTFVWQGTEHPRSMKSLIPKLRSGPETLDTAHNQAETLEKSVNRR